MQVAVGCRQLPVTSENAIRARGDRRDPGPVATYPAQFELTFGVQVGWTAADEPGPGPAARATASAKRRPPQHRPCPP